MIRFVARYWGDNNVTTQRLRFEIWNLLKKSIPYLGGGFKDYCSSVASYNRFRAATLAVLAMLQEVWSYCPVLDSRGWIRSEGAASARRAAWSSALSARRVYQLWGC